MKVIKITVDDGILFQCEYEIFNRELILDLLSNKFVSFDGYERFNGKQFYFVFETYLVLPAYQSKFRKIFEKHNYKISEDSFKVIFSTIKPSRKTKDHETKTILDCIVRDLKS